MLLRRRANVMFTQLVLCTVFLCDPVLAQRQASVLLGGAAAASQAGTSEPQSHEHLSTDSIKSSAAKTADRPASRPPDTRWVPADVDDSVPPVEPGTTCNLQEVLKKVGQRIQDFVANVDRFTATESLLYETLKKSGEVFDKENRKYEYIVSIEEIRPRILNVEEYHRSSSASDQPPGGILTKGLPELLLIFHPYDTGNFSMKCEGLAIINGERTWQIYFRQRVDKPNRTRAYRIGLNGPSYPIALKGRAWFAADSFQILSLQTDLTNSLPELRLTVDHTVIEYGPVRFASRNVDMWLPRTADLYSDWKGKRIHQRMTFGNYLLFAVDDKQTISSPGIGGAS
jgi:hypothetical protein